MNKTYYIWGKLIILEMLRLIKNYKMLFAVMCFTVLLISCANMGQGPQGGPRDWAEPALMHSTPKMNQTNVKTSKVELFFNENITLKDQSQKVIVTPPQKRMPIIKTANKKIWVELRDTLKENTTYTIDFTDAIEDNNEGNPLENFALSFSTGDVVDSLTISGRVIQAMDNEPVKGYYVGLHSNLEDTAFTHTAFERISRTNDKGQFTIRGIAPGKYHLFALDDKNRDYKYDNPMEALAFYDMVLEPTTLPSVRFDTIFTDTTRKTIDTIKTINYIRFLPDSIVMKSFLSDKKREYFRSAERKEGRLFTLNFGNPTKEPILEPLNFDYSPDWAILERNILNDSIYTYWIKDQSIVEKDTLLFSMTFNMTDTLNQLVTVTDSLKVVNRERKRKNDKKKKDEDEEIIFLELKSNIKSSWDVYDNIEFEFGEPIKDDKLKSLISLTQKIDTIYEARDYELERDSLNPRKYKLLRKWKYGEEYKLQIDSASIFSLYGLWNNKLEQSMKVKTEDQYGMVAITLSGLPADVPSFVELLDPSGKVLRKSKVRSDNAALFKNINPAKYYARVILDLNDNFLWDTGDYDTKRQPENVYYYPGVFDVRANWEEVITFAVDLESTSKPIDILKNKPVDRKKREEELNAKEQEERDKQKEARRQQEQINNPRGRSSY